MNVPREEKKKAAAKIEFLPGDRRLDGDATIFYPLSVAKRQERIGRDFIIVVWAYLGHPDNYSRAREQIQRGLHGF